MNLTEHLDLPPVGDLTPRQERLAKILAGAVHLLCLALALLSPYLFHSRAPLLPEVYTVDLLSAVESAAPETAEPAAPATPPRRIEPRRAKVKEAPAPAPAPAPAKKAVSLKPLKSKTEADLAEVERLRRQLQLQQRQAEAEQARQAADEAVQEALASIKEALAQEPRAVAPAAAPAKAASGSRGPSGPAGDGVVVDAAYKRYYAAVYERIRQYWVLPDYKNWDPNLVAIMVLEIRRDGIVTRRYFEQKSGNIHYNQAVDTAVEQASPLPPIPKEIKEDSLEIAFRFKPGDMF